jgi:hypothetical protein
MSATGVTCTNNKGRSKKFTVSNAVNESATKPAAASAAPVVAMANAADKTATAKAIAAEIVALAEKGVAKADLVKFNELLSNYLKEVPSSSSTVTVIANSVPEGDIAQAVKTAAEAVKASSYLMKGGRRKTHRKKHSMRSKRHCKTHKKHGGKRSTKHHKKHGKTRGKRSRKH